jgi:hypothetical protein
VLPRFGVPLRRLMAGAAPRNCCGGYAQLRVPIIAGYGSSVSRTLWQDKTLRVSQHGRGAGHVRKDLALRWEKMAVRPTNDEHRHREYIHQASCTRWALARQGFAGLSGQPRETTFTRRAFEHSWRQDEIECKNETFDSPHSVLLQLYCTRSPSRSIRQGSRARPFGR